MTRLRRVKVSRKKFTAILLFFFIFTISNLTSLAEAENKDSFIISEAEEPEAEEEETEETEGLEVLDEFDEGGLFCKVTDIEDGEIYAEVTGVVNDGATVVCLPETLEYEGEEVIIDAIGKEAFSDLKRLRKLVIAADISDIGKNAFKGEVKPEKIVVEAPKKNTKSLMKLFGDKGIKVKEIRAMKK